MVHVDCWVEEGNPALTSSLGMERKKKKNGSSTSLGARALQDVEDIKMHNMCIMLLQCYLNPPDQAPILKKIGLSWAWSISGWKCSVLFLYQAVSLCFSMLSPFFQLLIRISSSYIIQHLHFDVFLFFFFRPFLLQSHHTYTVAYYTFW